VERRQEGDGAGHVKDDSTMPYGLYLSAEGAHAQSRRLETIANNLANVNTVGFKRQLAVFQARHAQEIARGGAAAGSGSINDIGGGVEVRETKTDFSSGPMKWTGESTDMAIEGDGFFMVRKGNQDLLTRAGNFRLTEDGQLVTQQGYNVLTEDGEPVLIDLANGPWELMPWGAVRQQGGAQSLALVRPRSLGDLVQLGENLFRPLADVERLPGAERRVAGGYLELADVQATSEMVDMIEASRAVEANLNMVQTQDQMLAGLVNRLLKNSA
jgi:flagellar basal-body rod protein FlgF/flagellar basal-body rod protein FlgG